MTKRTAIIRTMLGTCCAVLTGSCVSVDHTPDLRQATGQLQRATGLTADWPQEMVELTLGETNTVTLDQALQLALANNRALRADLEVIGQARAELVQAGLLSNPILSVLLRFPEGGGRANIDFGLTKDFADLWLIPTRKRAAQGALQQRIVSFVDVAIALITDVKATYYTLQYQSLAADLQQENLRILREAMEIAQARFQAGDTTELDVNLIRGRLLEAEIELAQLRSDYQVTQQTLLRLMGVARAPTSWKEEPLSLEAPLSAITADEPELIEAALLRRFDIQAVYWELEAAVAEYEQQRLRFIPSLGLGLAGERSERRSLPSRKPLADTARASIASGQLTAPDIQSRAERRRERSQEIDLILGPSLEMPLPVFDQNQAQVARARFRVRELKQRYEETEQRVVQGVRSALAARRLAEQRSEFFQKSLVPLQQTNLDLAEAAYRAGTESILAVLFAQEALIRTRLNYAGAVRDLGVSGANLERELAGRLPELLPTEHPGP